MTRGRKPLPTAQKKLRGNPGKRKLNNEEPVYTRRAPDCPEYLTGLARKEWTRVVNLLAAAGVVVEIDRAALAAYCDAYQRWIEARQKVTKQGTVLTGPNGGLYQNPHLSVANKALEQMIKIASEFGMTPSSRSRLKVEKTPNEEDALEQFLFGERTLVVGDEAGDAHDADK